MFRGKKYRNQKHSRTYLDEVDFYQGTNMAQAAAEVSAFSNRAQAIFPPGSQPPFILRFDASTLPVGQLVLTSDVLITNCSIWQIPIFVRHLLQSQVWWRHHHLEVISEQW
jgi:hypothetical protein